MTGAISARNGSQGIRDKTVQKHLGIRKDEKKLKPPQQPTIPTILLVHQENPGNY